MGKLKDHFERKFLGGTLASIPLAVTIFILWYVDSRVRDLFPVRYPFVGILIALVALYILGGFVTSLVGRYFLHLLDWTLNHLPGLRDLYRTWKQIAVTPDMGTGVFTRVVM